MCLCMELSEINCMKENDFCDIYRRKFEKVFNFPFAMLLTFLFRFETLHVWIFNLFYSLHVCIENCSWQCICFSRFYCDLIFFPPWENERDEIDIFHTELICCVPDICFIHTHTQKINLKWWESARQEKICILNEYNWFERKRKVVVGRRRMKNRNTACRVITWLM